MGRKIFKEGTGTAIVLIIFGAMPVLTAMSNDIMHKEQVSALAEANFRFANDLYRKVSKPQENEVFSGHSVGSVLSMVALGSRGNTLQQFRDLLRLPESLDDLKAAYSDVSLVLQSDDDITLENANTIFPEASLSIKSSFIEGVKNHFQSEVTPMDFSDSDTATKKLNLWVEKNTNQKIQNLFSENSVNKDTKAVLINAIYFKGDWLNKFDKENTRDVDFFVSPQKSVKAPTMTSSRIKFPNGRPEGLRSTVLKLPYRGERISMYLILPDDKFGLDKLQETLTDPSFELSTLDDGLFKSKVEVSIPKFKIESSYDLESSLKALGATDMFNSKSDLSGIAGTPGQLYVSKVIQKAVVEINEEGSEAAAATGVVLKMRSMPLPIETINFDHPFAFMIRDSLTGLVLFSGKVYDPSA